MEWEVTTVSRPLGHAPDLTYEPSACNAALLECDWPEVLAGIDPQGVVHLSGVSALSRSFPALPNPAEGYHEYNQRRSVEDIQLETARRLRALRIERRVSRRQISDATGVGLEAIHNYEAGVTDLRRANTPAVTALADFFGVTVDYLRLGA